MLDYVGFAMPRPRKSIEQLKLSGTFQANKGRYRHLLDDGKTAPALHSMQPVRFRAPRHFSKEEKAAHREILCSMSGLTETDRLLVEVCAQLLVKQRAGIAKPSESNKLLTTLEKLRSRAASIAQSASTAATDTNKQESEIDGFFRESEEDDSDEILDTADMNAELERRRNEPMPDHLAEQQLKHYYSCYQVGLDLGITVKLYDSEGRFVGTDSRRHQERMNTARNPARTFRAYVAVQDELLDGVRSGV